MIEHPLYRIIEDAAVWHSNFFLLEEGDDFEPDYPEWISIPNDEIESLEEYLRHQYRGNFYIATAIDRTGNIRALSPITKSALENLPNKILCQVTWHLIGGFSIFIDLSKQVK